MRRHSYACHNTARQSFHEMLLSNEQTCASVAHCSLPAGERDRDPHTTRTAVEDTGIVRASTASTNPTHDQSRKACENTSGVDICKLRKKQRKFQGHTSEEIPLIESKYAEKVCKDGDHACKPPVEALYSTKALDQDQKMSFRDTKMEPGYVLPLVFPVDELFWC